MGVVERGRAVKDLGEGVGEGPVWGTFDEPLVIGYVVPVCKAHIY